MSTTFDPSHTVRSFALGDGTKGRYYSVAALESLGLRRVGRLPVCMRIVLESLLRHCDGKRVTPAHVRDLANWDPRAVRTPEIPFAVARVLLQDLSGLPAINDFAAMRACAQRLAADPLRIEPRVPVDLVVDHSIEVDVNGSAEALARNMEIEYQRNTERFKLLKWGQQAFSDIRVIPSGNGIVHQVNLEYLARGICKDGDLYYPDSLVGTDSHTPMVNGIGVLGWGVGGIEAMAAMLGEPVCFLTPDVIGVRLAGTLRAGVTATDLVLTITQQLRRAKVVGKFVEFFGAGAASLSAADRATVANMAADYGATCAYFPIDEKTLEYFRTTGRAAEQIDAIERYFRAQGLFGISADAACDYTAVIELNLLDIAPSVSGPRLPEQRLDLPNLKQSFADLLTRSEQHGGYGRSAVQIAERYAVREGITVGDGDVLIAAITSCTNTSNPRLMIAAGLLAKKAVERGLRVRSEVKTSFAPGSKVVTAYLRAAGLMPYLEQLGFHTVAYGCTTCMGNSGPLAAGFETALSESGAVACAVLSGNRNFEARIHPHLKANFLASPPLVVAFALAGTVSIDLAGEPLGLDRDGRTVYLHDLWPSEAEIAAALSYSEDSNTFKREYGNTAVAKELWDAVPDTRGALYKWDAQSTFILEPPFFEAFSMQEGTASDIRAARALAVFGDNITTDHISPNAAIGADSPAGLWLRDAGERQLSSYAMRRCNHHVMVRGTFGHVRLRNRLANGREGGYTVHQPSGDAMTIYDAAMRYMSDEVPLIVFAGEEYGTGSSRDWAARGTRLLGVRAVIARSFERIHRSNLIGMGVLPCELPNDVTVESLSIDGSETFDVLGISSIRSPRETAHLVIRRAGSAVREVPLTMRVDTPIEIEYLKHGGIMPFVLRAQLALRRRRVDEVL